ncbi:MAG: VOC family protein [Pseudomonadota bacterium]
MNQVFFVLYVDDQARSRTFYTAVLGQAPELDVPGMTEYRLGEKVVLGLMPNAGIRRLLGDTIPDPGLGSAYPRCEVYLLLDDLDAAEARAQNAGARRLAPRAARDWGDDVSYWQDGDGHIIGLARRSART